MELENAKKLLNKRFLMRCRNGRPNEAISTSLKEISPSGLYVLLISETSYDHDLGWIKTENFHILEELSNTKKERDHKAVTL